MSISHHWHTSSLGLSVQGQGFPEESIFGLPQHLHELHKHAVWISTLSQLTYLPIHPPTEKEERNWYKDVETRPWKKPLLKASTSTPSSKSRDKQSPTTLRWLLNPPKVDRKQTLR